MARCTIVTPESAIDAAFARLPAYLQRYKLAPGDATSTYPGVYGYGIDQQCPKAADTRDNRWLVWAARYQDPGQSHLTLFHNQSGGSCPQQASLWDNLSLWGTILAQVVSTNSPNAIALYQDPDDEFLMRCAHSILSAAFDEAGYERRTAAEQGRRHRDDPHHQYVWWLLQVALGYVYTGDTSLDSAHLRRIVETLYRLHDAEDVGLTHTAFRKFATSIGEPANTDAGQAYSFFHAANNVFTLRVLADLAQARGDDASRAFFLEKLRRLEGWLPAFHDLQTGFYYALREVETGRYTYRVAGPDKVTLMADNVYFPLAFGVLSEREMQPSLDYLEQHTRDSFPTPYAYPPYDWVNSGLYTAWWLPRSWQEPLCHRALAMRELERPACVYQIVHKQAERFALDDEVWEHYHPDTGESGGRRGYSTTSACLNIAIIEALFGLRPAESGFRQISVRPALPSAWPAASLDAVVSGQQIRYTIRQSQDRVTCDFSGSVDLPVHLVLPLPENWELQQVHSNVAGEVRWLRGEHRPCLEASFTIGQQPVITCRIDQGDGTR